MGIATFLPVFLSIIFYLSIIIFLFYLVNKWVTKFISLKQDQNDLLREILNKLEKK